jgi:hypothetical protein
MDTTPDETDGGWWQSITKSLRFGTASEAADLDSVPDASPTNEPILLSSSSIDISNKYAAEPERPIDHDARDDISLRGIRLNANMMFRERPAEHNVRDLHSSEDLSADQRIRVVSFDAAGRLRPSTAQLEEALADVDTPAHNAYREFLRRNADTFAAGRDDVTDEDADEELILMRPDLDNMELSEEYGGELDAEVDSARAAGNDEDMDPTTIYRHVRSAHLPHSLYEESRTRLNGIAHWQFVLMVWAAVIVLAVVSYRCQFGPHVGGSKKSVAQSAAAAPARVKSAGDLKPVSAMGSAPASAAGKDEVIPASAG